MYTTGDQCPDDDPNESRRAPHRPGHRPKYGTQTSNVEELDEKRLPPRQWYVIHTVGHRNRWRRAGTIDDRSEEHTSELQSLMRISYAVFCLKKQTTQQPTITY